MSADPAEVMESLDIAYVGAENLTDSVWWELATQLESACDETLTTQDLREYIMRKEAIAWLVLDGGEILASAVTQVRSKDHHKWLEILALGGRDWQRWAPMLHNAFETHAHAIGCQAITAHVRRGLERWLSRLGWRVRQVHMEFRTDG